MVTKFIFYTSLLLLLVACFTGSKDSAGSFKYAWVQAGPSGFIVRAITEDTCPNVFVDDVAKSMSLRVGPSNNFPVSVCELHLPQKVSSVVIKGQRLPAPSSKAKTTAILGDTGCLIKGKSEGGDEYGSLQIQDCLDPVKWPFAKVAANIISTKPNLIVHVGDYNYRMIPCPDNEPGCKGSPYGDNWRTWEADFFAPAVQLLQTAPWVVIRGNHEICRRNGEGWFRFLDPYPYTTTCKDTTDPYLVNYAKLHLAVFDNSLMPEDGSPITDLKLISEFKNNVTVLEKMVKQANWRSVWLLAHQPMWGVLPKSHNVKLLNQDFQNLVQSGPSLPFDLVISGHIHLFQALHFADQGPSQLIIGMSGTALFEQVDSMAGLEFSGRGQSTITVDYKFGHAIIIPNTLGGTSASVTIYDLDNKPSHAMQICRKQLLAPTAVCSDTN